MTNTILVVDDNPSSVAGLVDAFATSGLTAAGAHGFADALKMLEDVEPELLITGVRLGPYNGLHLVLRVRALYPNAAAILIGPADPMLARDARALGADAYLTTHAPDAILFEALEDSRPAAQRRRRPAPSRAAEPAPAPAAALSDCSTALAHRTPLRIRPGRLSGSRPDRCARSDRRGARWPMWLTCR